MDKFLEYLLKNWATIRQAPLIFIMALLLGLIPVSIVFKWIYSERIQTLQERVAAKDDLLIEYRQRLHLAPTDQTSHSRLSNSELRQKALNLVRGMREFLARFDEASRALTFAQMGAMQRATSEQERNAIWQRQTAQLSEQYGRVTAEYDRQFKADSILLRDELHSRLPAGTRQERVQGMYEHPTNPIGMGMVADDLERLAKLLP